MVRNNVFYNTTQRSVRLLNIDKPDKVNVTIVCENNHFYNVRDPLGAGHLFISGHDVRVSNISFFNSEVPKGFTLKANKATVSDISFYNTFGTSKAAILLIMYCRFCN